jgi:Mlc titration factor MtfA (ptsG expression regulator)
MAMKWFEHRRIRYALRHHPIPRAVWESLMREADIFGGLSAVERAHLRVLTTMFLHRKDINGVQGLTVSPGMAVVVAAQACLLILKLGLDYYDGWVEVVIYPGAFRVVRDSTDAIGLVSRQDRILSGESWSRGPLILSWDDVAADLTASDPGHNVVVHEFAHKLDMQDGSANGMPPLHPGMVRQQWTTAFSDAFARLQQQLELHHRPDINAYGATAPAEFFAVASEYFFADPHTLRHLSPTVYDQLVLFYRQDPASRQHESGSVEPPDSYSTQ